MIGQQHVYVVYDEVRHWPVDPFAAELAEYEKDRRSTRFTLDEWITADEVREDRHRKRHP